MNGTNLIVFKLIAYPAKFKSLRKKPLKKQTIKFIVNNVKKVILCHIFLNGTNKNKENIKNSNKVLVKINLKLFEPNILTIIKIK